MADSAVITLLTDFGTRDGYVGAMKGVIATLAPRARVVDISHEVEPGDVRGAGLVWAAAAPWFPPGSIHVAVVDPGVGTRRRVLALGGRRGIFLAPDNGLIGHVASRRQARKARSVRRRDLFLHPVSSTFHGRDIFAPVAARLAGGLPLEEVGPPLGEPRRDELPRPRRRREGDRLQIRSEVIWIDRFGNAITNIEPPAGARLLELVLEELRITRLSRAYGRGPRGRVLALVGSSGRVEVVVRGGSAAREHAIRVGSAVASRWRLPEE